MQFYYVKAKTSFLFRNKRADDMGFPSMCYEYALLSLGIKGVVLVNGLIEWWQEGNLNREKVDRVKGTP